ncbi:hypothetical protein CEXT_188991 [Caerostris extrusa]|uniref:Uncharacterized protein n=1 Tax=Caerostris extrusa TaxID=172846 RepID=A0AAV4NN11_CAEEX|nr:hypothetical protein CEXT_188991 [Caerostris extrusa]
MISGSYAGSVRVPADFIIIIRIVFQPMIRRCRALSTDDDEEEGDGLKTLLTRYLRKLGWPCGAEDTHQGVKKHRRSMYSIYNLT